MKKTMVVCAVLVITAMVGPAQAQERDEGVQFRTAFGVGSLYDNEPATGAYVQGSTFSMEGYLGATVVPHLVLGGYVSDTTTLQDSSSLGMNLFNFGPYADLYLRRYNHSGTHFLLTSGFSTLDLSGGASAFGGNIGAGLGYDWVVARHEKLGVLAKYSHAYTVFQNGVSDETDTLSLMFVITAY